MGAGWFVHPASSFATTNPVHFKNFFAIFHSHNLLTNSRRGTQHLVVHRFARKRDEKGMR
jgi:hypothetical protein